MIKRKLNNYFVAVYDYHDNYVVGYDDIRDLQSFFEIPLKRINEAIKRNYCLMKDKKKYKIYIYNLYKKD